jgi:hypothetical protein
MKVGGLVKVPDWQKQRKFWRGFTPLGSVGMVAKVTSDGAYILWSNGEYVYHEHSTLKHLEVISESR